MQSSIDDVLRHKIIDLTKQHKLTALEISCHFAERPDVTQTQQEIVQLLDELVSRGEFQIINAKQEPIYRPATLSPAEMRAWDLVDRTESARWVEENTTLGGFYRNRIYYLNVTKSLKTSGHDSYNHVMDPGGGPCEILHDGKKYTHFASNDYVGLASHPEVLEAARKTLETHGLGSGSSRLGNGTSSPHHELERAIARFKGAEAAIVVSSGYLMNLVMASVADENCVIFSDELNHASIIDGIRVSRVPHVRFAHNDMADLEEKLSKVSPSTRKFVIVEGIYSMDGDIVKLDELVDVARRYDARIGIDEAHSSGTLGARGRGVVEHFGVEPGLIEFKAGTLGKTFGASGGFIAGKQLVIDMLKYTARPFVFSTSLPAMVMAGARKAIEVLERHPELAQRIQANARYLRTRIKEMGFDTGLSETQIIPIILGDNDKVGRFYQALMDAGIFVNTAIHPIVPLKQARLRLSVSAAHTQQQMDYLLEILSARGRAFGII